MPAEEAGRTGLHSHGNKYRSESRELPPDVPLWSLPGKELAGKASWRGELVDELRESSMGHIAWRAGVQDMF